MFSKAKTAPIYNTLYLFAVDTSGFEFPIDKNKPFFLKPYNQRGFYHALTKSITKNGPSDILYSIGMKVKKNVRDTKSIRLYDLMCSCSYFTELSNSRLPQYLNSHCKKRLLNEVQLQ